MITSPEQPHSPASKCKATAYDKVIGTVELLDSILIHLPYIDLFRCQRINKHFKATIENTPKIQETMFLRASADFPCALPIPAGGTIANVEHPGQPLALLSHFETIGNLVFGGLATDFMRYTPPDIYPERSCWLFVRQADVFAETTSKDGSWQRLLLKNSGDAMDFDVVLCPDERFLNTIKTVSIVGKRTMGELVDAIRAEFSLCVYMMN